MNAAFEPMEPDTLEARADITARAGPSSRGRAPAHSFDAAPQNPSDAA